MREVEQEVDETPPQQLALKNDSEHPTTTQSMQLKVHNSDMKTRPHYTFIDVSLYEDTIIGLNKKRVVI